MASRRSEEPYPFSENNDHRILIWIAADGTEEISRKLAANNPSNKNWQRDLFVSYNKIGSAQRAQGELAAARESFRMGMAVSANLARDDPSNDQCQVDLSHSYLQIGSVNSTLGDLNTALELYHKALDIITKLTTNDPTNTSWQHDLAAVYSQIGDVQKAQNNLKAALESYLKAEIDKWTPVIKKAGVYAD